MLNLLKKNSNINFFFNKKLLNKFSRNINLINETNKLFNNFYFYEKEKYDKEKINNQLIIPTAVKYPMKQDVDISMPLKTGKPRLIIIGSGWAGGRLAKDIDCIDKYDITIISSKNHMVFTPLLASSCVGTVHNQSVIENIRHIQPGLSYPQNHFYLAHAEHIDFNNKLIDCVSDNKKKFTIGYDKLVIASGGKPQTFNIPGVYEHTYFLKNLNDSIKIRKKLLENICLAGIPNLKTSERNKLLHFVIVGGGPTGVELASEICNFINEDMYNYNPKIKNSIKITLIEGNELLNSFDKTLSQYAIQKLIQGGVYIKKAQVVSISKDNIILSDDSLIDYGLCVWSTGVETTKFINNLNLKKNKNGRIIVDDLLRVYNINENRVNNHVFALGDVCVNEKNPLPQLAQVAEQQGKFLAYYLNNIKNIDNDFFFNYHHFGSMISLTTGKGILEIGKEKKYKFTGLTSWIAWRSAYLTKLQSSKNKINIISQWLGTLIKGREIGF